jgi:hypothetical protein
VRSRLDSADVAASTDIFVFGEELGWVGTPSALDTTLAQGSVPEEVDPLADSDNEGLEKEVAKEPRTEPLSFDAVAKFRKQRLKLSRYASHNPTKDDMASALYTPPNLVLGTNPPDFSSPLMMAAIRVDTKRAKYQTM